MAVGTQTIQREHLRKQISKIAALAALNRPPSGWINTARTALGMSGAALSRRLGGGRTLAANLEHSEREDRATLRSMREAAEAMGCRFVYAIVPPEGQSIETLVEAQARRRATQLIREAAVHMHLEAQQLGEEDARTELERITCELQHHLPRDFWDQDQRDC